MLLDLVDIVATLKWVQAALPSGNDALSNSTTEGGEELILLDFIFMLMSFHGNDTTFLVYIKALSLMPKMVL